MALVYGVIDKDRSIVDRLIEHIMNMDQRLNSHQSCMASMMNHPVASHLIEKVIQTSHTETFQHIYTTHFRHKLQELSSQTPANYVVQTLISSVKSGLQALSISEEITESLEDILGKFDRDCH
jgi:hypothetical protein